MNPRFALKLSAILALALLAASCFGVHTKTPDAPKYGPWAGALSAFSPDEAVSVFDNSILAQPSISNTLDDSVLRREDPETVMPYYHAQTNCFFYPLKRTGAEFFNALGNYIAGSPIQPDLKNSSVTGEELASYIRNCYLIHEIGLYLRSSRKLSNMLDPFADEIYVQKFTASMIDLLEIADNTCALLRKPAAKYLDKLFKSSPAAAGEIEQIGTKITYNNLSASASGRELVRKYQLYSFMEILQGGETPEPAAEISDSAFKLHERDYSAFFHVRIFNPAWRVSTISSLGQAEVARGRAGYTRVGFKALALSPDGRPFFSNGSSVYMYIEGARARTIISGEQRQYEPTALAFTSDGRLVFADEKQVVLIDVVGRKTSTVPLAGAFPKGFRPDPFGRRPVAAKGDEIYFADWTGKRIVKISASGELAEEYPLPAPPGGLSVTDDAVYVTFPTAHVVGRVNLSDKAFTLISGLWNVPGHGDGRGFEVLFNRPIGIAAAKNGMLFIADSQNHAIRAVGPDGTAYTVAGGLRGDSDGPATTAQLDEPIDVALSPRGAIYAVEEGVPKVRVISQTGRPDALQPLASASAEETPGMDNPAIRKITKQIADAPIGAELSTLYWNRAAEYRKLKMYDNAVADIRKAAEFAKNKTSCFFEEARIEEERGREDAALEALNGAISAMQNTPVAERILDPQYIDAHRRRANLRLKKGDAGQAMEDFARFITLNDQALAAGQKGADQPVLADVYYAQATIYSKDGKSTEAEAAAIKAVRMKANFKEALLLLGAHYLAQEKLVKAKYLLDRVAKMYPNYPAVYFCLGQLYDSDARLYNPPKAADYYRKFNDYGGGGTQRDTAEKRIQELEAIIEKSKTTGFYYLDDIEKDDAGNWFKIRRYAAGSKIERFPLSGLENVDALK
jgi:tetratricopeptide (TPR) repeat protein